MKNPAVQVVIVGGGPAGLTAAIALAGAGVATALVAKGPLRIARYYVAMTAAIAVAFFDWLRTGTPAGWEQAEGTR